MGEGAVHRAAGHVGICTSEPKRCDRRPLNKTDIIIHQLNITECPAPLKLVQI